MDRGSSGSFEAFYAATAKRTFTVVRRIAGGNPHVAYDATQEAYLVLLRSWPARRQLSDEVNRRYVVGIAAHKVSDWYRQYGRQAILDDDPGPPADETGFAAVLDEMSVLKRVREVIAEQPERRRTVAVLYFLEDASCHEIARALEITESTVRTHVERMRGILKPLIAQITELNQGGGGHD